MTLGYCPTCGAEGSSRERRPNGNDTGVCGHVYPSSAALTTPVLTETGGEPTVIVNGESMEALANYRSRLDAATERLAGTLYEIGFRSQFVLSDDEVVDVASNKLRMLCEMLLAGGMNPGVLAAALKG